MAPFRVLVFSKTAGYRHECIPAGIAMFHQLAAASLGTSRPFVVDASEDAAACFTPASLAQFAILVLFQCSGNFLEAEQIAALQSYVRSGRGSVLGVHAALGGMSRLAAQATASGTNPDPEGFYGKMLGGVSAGHPEPQLGRVIIRDRHHVVLQPLFALVGATEASAPEPSFSWFDEWYNLAPGSRCCSGTAPVDSPRPHTLLAVDESTYAGGHHGEDHPIAWTWPDFDGTGTRVFYSSFGHFAATYEDETFMAFMREAILWAAAGNNRSDS